jgi:hypothetical protein
LEGTGSTLFSDRLFWRKVKFGRNWLHIIFRQIVLEIWRELAPHYFPTDCFGGSSDLAVTGSTLFPTDCFEGSSNLAGSGSTLFLTDCFVGSSNLEGTCSTLFSGGLFWKFRGNWVHIIFQFIVLEEAQIWR